MTLNLNINTGIRLTINDDPDRVIRFNPSDVDFAARFYALIQEFESKQAEYQARADALDAATDEDEHGLPANLPDRIAFMRDVCEYMHAQIDLLFGAGAALTVFQGQHDLDAITQFFQGITPFIQKARSEKVEQYAPKRRKAARAMR